MTEKNSTPLKKRPWHLWVVGVLALLWSAMGAMNYVMTQTKNEAYMGQFTAEQLEFFYGLPAWAVSCWAIAVWGGILGAILLLLRKRIAYPVFLVSFIAMVLTTIHSYCLSNGLEIMGDPLSLLFSAAIFLISLALVFYAQRLRKKEILV